MSKLSRLGLPRLGLALALALALPSCADKKDWDSEILVQVFKPKLLDLSKVTVTVRAEQGKKSGQVELTNAFLSCTTNQVRIIPTPGGPDLQILATAGQLSASATVKPGQTTPVKLVLGIGIEPQPAACAPEIRIDGGLKRRTADPCLASLDCQGGVCITKVDTAYPIVPDFIGGYCSSACTTGTDAGPGSCAADELCTSFQNAKGETIASYCLLKCSTGDAGITPRCRLANYHCTTGNLCYPNT